jgi:chromosomal replication initiation ATPase DnaA
VPQNKESVLENSPSHALKNKESVLENSPSHALKNKESVLENSPSHVPQNKESVLENSPSHALKNKELVHEDLEGNLVGEEAYVQPPLPVVWSLPYRPGEFVVTDCNSYAFEWLEKWPFKIHENFACLVGETSSGKTNLAMIWAKRVEARVFNAKDKLFERWMGILSDSCEQYFVLDDADEIEDDILLFYIYNSVKEKNAYMLFTAKTPPIRWNLKIADIRSRVLTISVLNIQKPNEEAAARIIKQMLRMRGIEILDDVVEYIITHSERTYKSINSLVNKIDNKLISKKRQRLTIQFLNEYIEI